MIAADFAKLAHERAPFMDGADWGDHRNNEKWMEFFQNRKFTNAAVLIPIIDRPDGAQVLFTYRSVRLNKHAGQISFPGGKIDPEDKFVEAAALRELNEEIGVDRSDVPMPVAMPQYLSGSGFRVHPVIGVIPADAPMTLNPDEVESTFEVPLSFLMDGQSVMKSSRDDLVDGLRVYFYEYVYEGHRIWGITAGIVNSIRRALFEGQI